MAGTKKRARVGQVVYWLEDHSGPESGPEPPVECYGPVVAIAADGKPIVQSYYDGERMKLSNWTRVPKKYRQRVLGRDRRKAAKFVGGRRRR